MAARVHVVALLYHPELAERTVACAKVLVGKLQRRGHAGALLAITNNPKIDCNALTCETRTHDNSGLEFGGYQHGLEALAPLRGQSSVLFLNDTCINHHVFGVVPRGNLLASASDMAAQAGPAAAGVVTRSHVGGVTVQGLRVDRWISTWAFAINRAGLDALAGRIYEPSLDLLVPGASSLEEFWHPSVDPRLVARLNAWLFGAPGQHRWYKAAPLTRENAAAFAQKARCILQERYLSARLLQHHAPLHCIRPTGWPQRALHCLQCAREGRPAGFI
jgi:hypothetical protein